MRHIHKKVLWYSVMILLCYIGFYHNEKQLTADNSKRYLVLVEEKDGTWTQHNNLVEISKDGNIMVRAKLVSKALGLTYEKKKNGAFDIKRNVKRYNSYSRGESKFIYINGAAVSKLTTSHYAYTSDVSKYNLCHISSLSTLVHYKLFDESKVSIYDKYDGVICYSKYNKIPETVPMSLSNKSAEKDIPVVTEPSVVTIEGVEFPVREKFLTSKNALSDWGGIILLWNKLESKVDQKILPSTDLIVGTDTIEFTHLTSGSNGVLLKKVGKGYDLSIGVRLTGSVISDQNAMVVKAMITTISSKPSTVYQAIIESFTTDNNHGINKDKYVVIGDCKIKLEVVDDIVIYHIREA